MTDHAVGTRDEWLAARKELLQREKELTRLSDELAEQRRELPWVPVDKEYEFDTDAGTKTLAELFDGRSQLFVYHFMFGPSYELGCPTCSSMADGYDGRIPHLNARDVTFMCVSRAPLEKLQAYKQRMGWDFEWASSAPGDFNSDFGVSFTEDEMREGVDYNYAHRELGALLEGDPPPVLKQMAEATGTTVPGYVSEGPGASAFALEDGAVYHTYSSFARGCEFLMGYYPVLDRVAKGRDEGGGEFWIRRHDEYEAD